MAGAVAGAYFLVAGGLGALRAGPERGIPVVAAEGAPSVATDDPAVTVLRPTPSPAPAPSAGQRHTVTPKQLPASAASGSPALGPAPSAAHPLTPSDSPPSRPSPSASMTPPAPSPVRSAG